VKQFPFPPTPSHPILSTTNPEESDTRPPSTPITPLHRGFPVNDVTVEATRICCTARAEVPTDSHPPRACANCWLKRNADRATALLGSGRSTQPKRNQSTHFLPTLQSRAKLDTRPCEACSVETPYSYSSAKRLPWTRIVVLTLLRSSLTPQPYIYRLLGPYQFDGVNLVGCLDSSFDGLGQSLFITCLDSGGLRLEHPRSLDGTEGLLTSQHQFGTLRISVDRVVKTSRTTKEIITIGPDTRCTAAFHHRPRLRLPTHNLSLWMR
jgi:hypothetical protein